MKLTQIELAEKINYSDKAISKWERGESIPDVSVLLNLAKLFGVNIEGANQLRRRHKEEKSSAYFGDNFPCDADCGNDCLYIPSRLGSRDKRVEEHHVLLRVATSRFRDSRRCFQRTMG